MSGSNSGVSSSPGIVAPLSMRESPIYIRGDELHFEVKGT